jgi:hypothetical protein
MIANDISVEIEPRTRTRTFIYVLHSIQTRVYESVVCVNQLHEFYRISVSTYHTAYVRNLKLQQRLERSRRYEVLTRYWYAGVLLRCSPDFHNDHVRACTSNYHLYTHQLTARAHESVPTRRDELYPNQKSKTVLRFIIFRGNSFDFYNVVLMNVPVHCYVPISRWRTTIVYECLSVPSAVRVKV